MTSSSSTSSGLPRTRRISWLRSHLLIFSDQFTSSNNNTLTTTCSSLEDPSGAGYGAIGITSTVARCPPQPFVPKLSSDSNTFPAKDESFWNSLLRLQVLRLIFYTACVFGYLTVGVLVFQWLEAPVEEELSANFLSLKAQFITDYGHYINQTRLEQLLKEAIALNNRGIVTERNRTIPNWTYGQTFFFVVTLVTTIGYGRNTPQSATGKLFAIAYASLGIPLAVVLLSALSERLRRLLSASRNRIIALRCFYLVCNTDASESAARLRWVDLLILVFFVGALVFAAPVAFFVHLEPDWSVLDALYYVFISMTTVGFGDYIPGDHAAHTDGDEQVRSLYKAAVAVYLLVGLTCMMLLYKTLHEIPQLNLERRLLCSERVSSVADSNPTSHNERSKSQPTVLAAQPNPPSQSPLKQCTETLERESSLEDREGQCHCTQKAIYASNEGYNSMSFSTSPVLHNRTALVKITKTLNDTANGRRTCCHNQKSNPFPKEEQILHQQLNGQSKEIQCAKKCLCECEQKICIPIQMDSFKTPPTTRVVAGQQK